MSETAIRTLLKAIMESVTDIGVVHDYERFTNTEAGMKQYFKATIGGQDQIRGWMINRRSASEKGQTTASPNLYVLRGFLGLDDSAETEKTMTALIESIRAKFRADTSLYNAGYPHDPVQVAGQDLRMFGGLLCHHAELTISVYDLIT